MMLSVPSYVPNLLLGNNIRKDKSETARLFPVCGAPGTSLWLGSALTDFYVPI
jgi:hypothetical protein